MADNIQRSGGKPRGYNFDRGGTPAEMGPYIGTVVNNIDNTRSGRLQVYIEEFGAVNKDGSPRLNDPTLWRTVNYLPPFYGVTQKTGTSTGVGTYPGNQQSYGMWFTPPDIGVSVLCFFVAGDPAQGYYVGCIPEPGINHMIPAIGSSTKYQTQNKTQKSYFADAKQLPVTELNSENKGILNSPKFYEQPKPVHSFQAAVMFQQGLDNDTERGPIASNSQRESPSTVYGISTPGQPIYQGGLDPNSIRKKLQAGTVKPQDVRVIGRQGGHTFVMDDGDLDGKNSLVRLRTAKGHQITMSDSGNFFYIIHANGLTWLELGSQGTVDIFSTNSINLRSKGDINVHADRDINMFAGRTFNLKSNGKFNIESQSNVGITAENELSLYSKTSIGVLSDGRLVLNSDSGGWDAGGSMSLRAGRIDLNGGSPGRASKPQAIVKTSLPDTMFNSSTGWEVKTNGIESIVKRAPTHEPYPYHNKGVDSKTKLEDGQPPPSPSAEPVPADWSITADPTDFFGGE
jgi:hypothetical protein